MTLGAAAVAAVPMLVSGVTESLTGAPLPGWLGRPVVLRQRRRARAWPPPPAVMRRRGLSHAVLALGLLSLYANLELRLVGNLGRGTLTAMFAVAALLTLGGAWLTLRASREVRAAILEDDHPSP